MPQKGLRLMNKIKKTLCASIITLSFHGYAFGYCESLKDQGHSRKEYNECLIFNATIRAHQAEKTIEKANQADDIRSCRFDVVFADQSGRVIIPVDTSTGEQIGFFTSNTKGDRYLRSSTGLNINVEDCLIRKGVQPQ